MRDWMIIGVLYVLSLGLFRLLGGFRGAGEAFQKWGRANAAARACRVSPSS
ncbi:MAG: hypothetical protein ACRDN6_06605 [Gaiellaceae bacterium]